MRFRITDNKNDNKMTRTSTILLLTHPTKAVDNEQTKKISQERARFLSFLKLTPTYDLLLLTYSITFAAQKIEIVVIT